PPAHLDPVVRRPDAAREDDGAEHEQRRPGERGGRADMAEEVARDHGTQHGDAAHGRRPGLERVMSGTVDAYLLADPPADQPAQQYRGPEAGHEDRHGAGGE